MKQEQVTVAVDEIMEDRDLDVKPHLSDLDIRVLYIWDSDYPWDIRVEKVCNTLLENGAEVHVVCRNTRNSPSYEQYKGLHLHRVFSLSRPRRLGKSLSFPAFFNPLWLYKMLRVAREQDCNMIVVRDLPLAPTAIAIGRILGLPVVFDMAECYPEMLRCTWKFSGFKLKNVFVRNPKIADFIERWVLRRVAAVFAMIEESRDRLLEMGVPAHKIIIVSNTPILERFSTSTETEAKSVASDAGPDHELHLAYIGSLNPPRGLDVVVRAVGLLRDEGIRVNVDIAGKGTQEGYLRSLTRELGIDSQIRFLGWIDNSEVPGLIARADAGLVPHLKCSHWDTTIPNKLFDYLAASRPVIVSGAIPARRIVKSEDCGLAYSDDDPRQLADCMKRLRSSELRVRMATNGLRALRERYNWKVDARRLLDSVCETRMGSMQSPPGSVLPGVSTRTDTRYDGIS